MKLSNRWLSLCFILVLMQGARSQTTWDAEVMSKYDLCLFGGIGADRWAQYWEKDKLFTNQNIGTLKKNTYFGMAAYGITDRLNLITQINFIDAYTTAGSVAGNKGIQDASLHIKFQPLLKEVGSFYLKSYLVLGGSVPLSKYNEDAGPTSIGLGCKELNGRVMAEIAHKSGLFLRSQYSHHLRSSATLDRNFFYSNGGVYSDQINMPQMSSLAFTLGARILKETMRIETNYILMHTLGGSDIRPYDAPLANGNMDAKQVNGVIKYEPNFTHGFGLMLLGGKVLEGRNVGKANFIMGGITYRFPVKKLKINNDETK